MERHDLRQAPVKTLTCRVDGVEVLTRDVIRVFLVPVHNENFRHRAGQYVDIVLDDGVRRSFSIANAPHPGNDIELHIRHVSGGEFSDFVFNRMKIGDTLRVRGPYGDFFLREESRRPAILMAGGTGFAPIKGIIEHALRTGADRSMHLYWGARTNQDLYLHHLAQSWNRQPNFSYVPVLSEADQEPHWGGRNGFVHLAVLEDFPSLRDFEVYANGPRAMVTSARRAFVTHGLPERYFYYDAS